MWYAYPIFCAIPNLNSAIASQEKFALSNPLVRKVRQFSKRFDLKKGSKPNIKQGPFQGIIIGETTGVYVMTHIREEQH